MTKVWVDREVDYGTFPTDMQGASSWWLMQTVSRFGHFRTEAAAYVDFSFTIDATRTIRIGVAYDSADSGPSKATQFTDAGWTRVSDGSGHPMSLTTPTGMNSLKLCWYEKSHTAGTVTLPMPDMYEVADRKLHGVMYVVAVPGAATITNTSHAPMPWAYSGNAPAGAVDYPSSELLKWFWGVTYTTRPSYADNAIVGSVCQTPTDLTEWQTWFANGGTPYASMALLIVAVNADTSIGTIPRIYFMNDGTYNNVGPLTINRSGTATAPLYIFAETADGVVLTASYELEMADRSWIWVDGFKHSGTNTGVPYHTSTASRAIALNRIHWAGPIGNNTYFDGRAKWYRGCYLTVIDPGTDGRPALNSKNNNGGFGIYDHIYVNGDNCIPAQENSVFEDNNDNTGVGFSLNYWGDILFADMYNNLELNANSNETEILSEKMGGHVVCNWTITNSVGSFSPRTNTTQVWYEGVCIRDDNTWAMGAGGRSGGFAPGTQSVCFDGVVQNCNTANKSKQSNSALIIKEGDTPQDATFDCTVEDTSATIKTLMADLILVGNNVSIAGGPAKAINPSNNHLVNVLAKGTTYKVFDDPNGVLPASMTCVACQGMSTAGLGIAVPSGWTNSDPLLSTDANGWYQASGSSLARDDTYIKGVPYYKDRAPASHNLVTTTLAGHTATEPSTTDETAPTISVALAATGGANIVDLTITATDTSDPITVDWYRLERVLVDESFDENTVYNIDNEDEAGYVAIAGSLTYPPVNDPNYDGTDNTTRQYGKMSIGTWGADYEWEPSTTGFKMTTVGTPGTQKRYLFANCNLVEGDFIIVTPAYTWTGANGTLELLMSNNTIKSLASGDSGVPVIATMVASATTKPNVQVVANGAFDGRITGLSVYRKVTAAALTQTSQNSGVQHTEQDTGLADNTVYYYIAKVTDAAGNVTWSDIDSATTNATGVAPVVANPILYPTSGTANGSLTILVAQDSANARNTYYTTDGVDPTTGSTLVTPISGVPNLGSILLSTTVAVLKVKSFYTGVDTVDDSDVVTAGTYTVVAAPTLAPLCSSFGVGIRENSNTNEIDYLTLGSCSDPGSFDFEIATINGEAILTEPQTVTTTNGSVTHQASKMYYTPTTDYLGTDPFTYTLTNGTYASTAATITPTITVVGTPIVDDIAFTSLSQTFTNAIDVLSYCSDPDGFTLTIWSVNDELCREGEIVYTPHGSLSNISEILYYVPDVSFTGTEVVEYKITNGTHISDYGTITITTVRDITSNSTQVSYIVEPGAGSGFSQAGNIATEASITSAYGDTLAYEVTLQPTEGSLSVDSNGNYVFTFGTGSSLNLRRL